MANERTNEATIQVPAPSVSRIMFGSLNGLWKSSFMLKRVMLPVLGFLGGGTNGGPSCSQMGW